MSSEIIFLYLPQRLPMPKIYQHSDFKVLSFNNPKALDFCQNRNVARTDRKNHLETPNEYLTKNPSENPFCTSKDN